MVHVEELEIGGQPFTATSVALPKTNLLIVSNEIGYIMCAALDVDIFNELLADRKVIAARAKGVRSIQDLLDAPLEKVTNASKEAYGWTEGMRGKDALLQLAERG